MQRDYLLAHVISSPGSRVTFYTCIRCGMALVLTTGISVTAVHDKWHEDHDIPPTLEEGDQDVPEV